MTDPHTSIRQLIAGMLELERDAERGEQMIVEVCSKDLLTADRTKLHDRESIKRLLASRDIARSYAGGTLANGYTADGTVAFDTEYSKLQGVDYPEPGRAKLFVTCGGADTPRPVELRKNPSGQWKVTAWSSLQVGVKKPAEDF